MIKFFRKIRRRLVVENSPRKYLIYAIGEILLVVVGILIALQINNWSEQRKNRSIELQILNVVYDNLTNDLDDFEKNLIHLNNRKKASRVLIQCAEKNSTYHDSLAYHFWYIGLYPHFSPNVSGYEMLKSKGLEFISNDSLRLAITDLYEYGYKYLHTWESERINLIRTAIYPVLRRYTGTSVIDHRYIPTSLDNSRDHLTKFASAKMVLNIHNFEALKKDAEMLALLAQINGISNLLILPHQDTQSGALALKSRLEKELRLKK